MSKLLFNTHPLVIDPELAELIGLNESIILQQIHYWLEINRKANRNLKDGYYWTFNTYANWRIQFPFWSVETIKRTVTGLEKKGLVISDNFNRLKIDRTKWYRINYEALNSLMEVSGNGRVNLTSSTGQNDLMGRTIDSEGCFEPVDLYIAGEADENRKWANRVKESEVLMPWWKIGGSKY